MASKSSLSFAFFHRQTTHRVQLRRLRDSVVVVIGVFDHLDGCCWKRSSRGDAIRDDTTGDDGCGR